MKKLFTAIIALTMTISTFAACGNVAESEPAAATTQSASVTTTAEPEVATTKPVTTPKATEVTTTSEAVISVDFTTPEVTAPPVITTTTTAVTTVTTTTAKQTTTTKKTTTAKKTTTTKKKTTTAKTTTTPRQTTTAPKKTTTTTTTTTAAKISDEERIIQAKAQCDEVIRLINVERQKLGIEPLISDPKMMQAAQIRSEETVMDEQAGKLVAHYRPNGEDCFSVFEEVGLTNTEGASEVLTGGVTPEDPVYSWMNSPEHRAAILSPAYKYIGCGCYPYLESNNWILYGISTNAYAVLLTSWEE